LATIVPHLLFNLERFDRGASSFRPIGGVLIAMENPVYVGRLLVGSDDVEDKSELVTGGKMTADLFRDLQAIGEHPGREVSRDLEELWILFDDPEMTEHGTTIVFERSGRRTSFVRRPDRYESILREFVSDLVSRQPRPRT
jgi:hypothetical protein